MKTDTNTPVYEGETYFVLPISEGYKVANICIHKKENGVVVAFIYIRYIGSCKICKDYLKKLQRDLKYTANCITIRGENCKNICRDPGSNRGPLDLQSNALPTELSRHC